MPKDFKYHATFASKITKITNPEIKQYISMAGLERLTPLLPENVNLENNPDLIGIVANAAVAGKRNLNGDAITNKTAVAIAKNFVWKFCDINHKRAIIKGVICNYGFSELGTNKILTEAEVLESKEPINISLAILLWKIALNDEFIEELEESCDETSDLYGNLSLSWEILFNDYDVAIGPNEVSQAKLITNEEEKEKLKDKLQANGGTGKDEDKYVYRVIKGETNDDFCLPSGVGIVENPAGRVKGLHIIEAKDKEEIQKTSTSQNLSVNHSDNKNKISSSTNMKITKITDLTTEVLQKADASLVHELHDFIVTSIEEGSKQWVEEKQKVQKSLDEIKANSEVNEKAKVEAENKLKEVSDKLEKIEAEIQEKKQQEVFNIRMEALSEEYDLNNDENKDFRAIVAKKIFGLNDEDYKNFETEAKVMWKEKSKEFKKGKKVKEDEEKSKKEKESKASVETKESKASTENKETIVDDAVNNAEKEKTKVTNTTSATAKTMKEKYASAFNEDQFEIVGKK